MNGNNAKKECTCKSFKKLYDMQLNNQQKLVNENRYKEFTSKTKKFDKLPKDDISLFSYHIQQLQSEIGELLRSDKRWKNFRNDKLDESNKIEELADCFIVLLNISIFSGIDCDKLYNEIGKKIEIVKKRIDDEFK